ncbi:prostaglandin D2 receptor-like [Conger conger]|nr:prostaglandin D2 receptor-like [Conger conger]
MGLIGNIIALCIIYRHKNITRGRHVSVFYVLVSGLAWSDLLGKVLLSSMVLACYALSKCLEQINTNLCNTFGLLMSFFGLCPTLILLAIAVECLLSVGYPYVYNRQVTRRRALMCLISIYVFCLLFCALPLIGFGDYKQYRPGTWCFITLNSIKPLNKAFSLLYATLLTLAILAVVICNMLVKINLIKMYKLTRKRSISTVNSLMRAAASPRHSEELDHLVVLLLMTLSFVICSIPVTVRLYIGAFSSDECAAQEEEKDLLAMRFLSVNSIVDPWVFIILRTSLCRKQVHKLFDKLFPSRAPRTAAKTPDSHSCEMASRESSKQWPHSEQRTGPPGMNSLG